jgi:hypothetical protein
LGPGSESGVVVAVAEFDVAGGVLVAGFVSEQVGGSLGAGFGPPRRVKSREAPGYEGRLLCFGVKGASS